jgi:putative ABC transport system permease protein
MSAERKTTPPALARWLLRRTLDGAPRSAIVGDLDEEFTRYVLPQFGARAARRWYWRQAIMSIVACIRARAERSSDPERASWVNVATTMPRRDGLAADLRSAMRVCARNPLTSAAVILTLAIGVAANTALFSVLNASLLKKLPIENAEKLVSIETRDGGSFTYPEYLATRNTPGLRAVIAGGRTSALMTHRGGKRRVVIDMITANYFEALGVRPASRGRLLQADDDLPGRPPVAILNNAFWRNHFAADPDVVGTSVKLHHAFFTIAGIAPEGFAGTQIGFAPDLWVPLTQAPLIENNPAMLGPSSAWLGMDGILEHRDARGIVQDAMAARWRAAGTRDEPVVQLIPRGHDGEWSFRDPPAADTRLKLVSLFVVLILVVGCLNVSILLGAQVHDRQRELAIRASLGAGRLRLLRQLLAEHVLLATQAGMAGGTLGVFIARTLASLLTPADLDVSVDARVLFFTIAISLIIGLAVGALPALRWSKVDALAILRSGNAGVSRVFRSSGLWWLIPGQVALGTVLLTSAGVLIKTVHELKAGIAISAPERIWFADLHKESSFPSAAAFADFQANFRAHLTEIPGAEAAGLSTGRPLATIRRGPLRVEGMTTVPKSQPMPWGPPPPPPPRGAQPLEQLWIVSNDYVTQGFFPAMGLTLLKGRDFTTADSRTAPRVAIVNQTLATRAFGTANPIGRRVSWAMRSQFDITIVGVVSDLRSEDLRQPAPDAIFFPLAQLADADTAERTSTGALEPIDLRIVLRSHPGQQFRQEQIARHVSGFDSTLFIDRVWTFDEEAGRALSQERLLAWLGSTFSAIALALLIVGLYGVLAAAVVRGRRELGIRLALGATPGSLRTMVISRGLGVIAVGLFIGLPLSYAFVRSFARLLYGVAPIEPLVVVTTISTVVATAILGACVPAHRAARVDPIVALRTE